MLETPPIGPQTLLVGPQALALGPSLGGRLASAQCVLEAVLVSQPGTSLILVDVAPETDHLESAIRSLRDVNPEACILLLANPAEESACLRALGWGADQYEILPLDTRIVQNLKSSDTPLSHRDSPPSPATPAPSAASSAVNRTDAVPPQPTIPLTVLAALLEEILEGAGLRPDFAQNATRTLQRQLNLPGTLRFDTADAPAPPGLPEHRREVSFTGQAPYGTLVWQPAPPAETRPFGSAQETPSGPSADDGDPAAWLSPAAHWLGTMLALSQRYEQLRSMAATDELSGAFNRRYFIKFMTRLLERAADNRFRVTLLLLDIDDFKQYNDRFGHASGDAIIRELVKLLRLCIRTDDLVARLGGDEFAVVFWDSEAPRQPNSDHPKDVLVVTERFRKALRNHSWPETCKIKGTISISGGLATFPWHARSLDALMVKADQALLQAKSAGKNVIVMTPDTPEPAAARTP